MVQQRLFDLHFKVWFRFPSDKWPLQALLNMINKNKYNANVDFSLSLSLSPALSLFLLFFFFSFFFFFFFFWWVKRFFCSKIHPLPVSGIRPRFYPLVSLTAGCAERRSFLSTDPQTSTLCGGHVQTHPHLLHIYGSPSRDRVCCSCMPKCDYMMVP